MFLHVLYFLTTQVLPKFPQCRMIRPDETLQLWLGPSVKLGQVVFSRGGHVKACFSAKSPAVKLISFSQHRTDLSAIRAPLILFFTLWNLSLTQSDLWQSAAELKEMQEQNTKTFPDLLSHTQNTFSSQLAHNICNTYLYFSHSFSHAMIRNRRLLMEYKE